jgi:hypothetical protein
MYKKTNISNNTVIDETASNQEMMLPDYKRTSIDEHLDNTALIFLGWKGKIKESSLLYSRFNKEHKIIYQLPSNLISHDLDEAKDSWDFVTNKINEDVMKYNIKTVYGISLGVSLALYTANRSENIEQVILALPTDDLSEVIWNSVITKSIVRNAKRNGLSKDDYNNVLDQYAPINNINNLHGKRIMMFVAKGDKITPYENSMNLINEMKRQNLDIHVKEVSLVGHIFGGIYSLLDQSWF